LKIIAKSNNIILSHLNHTGKSGRRHESALGAQVARKHNVNNQKSPAGLFWLPKSEAGHITYSILYNILYRILYVLSGHCQARNDGKCLDCWYNWSTIKNNFDYYV